LRDRVRTGKTVRRPVSSGIVSNVSEHAARDRAPATRRDVRALAIVLLGPLVMLGGLVWAVAQPYRVTFLYPDGKGFYDHAVQPPLLVVAVGVVFALLIAPGLVEDLESEDRGPSA
jgi:hypothetical protein